VPDEGNWECHDEGDKIVCVGDHMPENTAWECVENEDGTVTCTRDAYYPDLEGVDEWNCYYDGEFRICEGTYTGGDSDGDSDSDGDTDCECIPNTWRYCDTPIACHWGRKICKPDETWERNLNNPVYGCIETDISAECYFDPYWYDYKGRDMLYREWILLS